MSNKQLFISQYINFHTSRLFQRTSLASTTDIEYVANLTNETYIN
jgi:hypothetical protein